MNSVSLFYDDMAENYHLIASGWDDEVRRQGNVLLHLLVEKFATHPGAKVLDCSCGIGTQAIGLALQGYEVTGSDISRKEIERAIKEAKRFGVSVAFKVEDFLTDDVSDKGQFEAVVSFDNAVAHLNDTAELERAFAFMRKKLKKGGSILISARDYDELRKTKPTGTVPRLIEDEFGERIYFQTWKWNEVGSAYCVNLFVLRPSEAIWAGKPLQTKMRAFTSDEIKGAMVRAGLKDVRRLSASESGYYQPVFVGSET